MKYLIPCFSSLCLLMVSLSSAFAASPSYREASRLFSSAIKISNPAVFSEIANQTLECTQIFNGQVAADEYMRLIPRGSKVVDQVTGNTFSFSNGDLREDTVLGGDPSCKVTHIARIRSNGDLLMETLHCKSWKLINSYMHCTKGMRLQEPPRDKILASFNHRLSTAVRQGQNTFIAFYGDDSHVSILKLDPQGKEISRLDSPTFSKLLNGEFPEIFYQPKLFPGKDSELFILGYNVLAGQKTYTLVAVSTDFTRARVVLRGISIATRMHLDGDGNIVLVTRAGWRDPKAGTGIKIVSPSGQILDEQFYENVFATITEDGARLPNGKTLILADCFSETKAAIGCVQKTGNHSNRGLVLFDASQKKERFIQIDESKFSPFLTIESISPNADGTFWVVLQSMSHNGSLTLLKMDEMGNVLNEIGVNARKNRSTLVPEFDFRDHMLQEVDGLLLFPSDRGELIEVNTNDLPMFITHRD